MYSRYLYSFGIFTAGCICEYYTGRTVNTKYNSNGKTIEINIAYDSLKGTGIGYGTILALLLL